MPIKTALRKETIPLFDEEVVNFPLERSDIYNLVIDRKRVGISKPAYSRKNGLLFTGNSLHWLKLIETNSVDLIFADPPYNIQKASWDKFDSQDGVYYCDLRPVMYSDPILKENIKTIDCLLIDDIWEFL